MLTLVVEESAEQKVNPVTVLTNPFAVTLTLPLVPLETTAVIVESFCTVKLVAFIPPKFTFETFTKFVPFKVTVVPV